MAYKRCPSLLGALLWIACGVLFLLHNFGVGPDIWSLAARYWPVLLILLGLGKICDYFLKKEAVSIRAGEIVGVILLVLIGTAVTKASRGHMGRLIREMPIQLGNASVRPGQWLGSSYTYSDEVTYPLESVIPIKVENAYGSVSIMPGSDREIRATLRKIVYAGETRAKAIASEIRLEGKPESEEDASTPPKAEAEPGKMSGARYFVLRTNRDALSSRDYHYKTDLEIRVPKDSRVEVISSYGSVRVAEIDGPLKVSARYSECRLANLGGSVDVSGRGRMYVDKVNGDVTLRNEYSPSEIMDVNGKVTATCTEGNLKVAKIAKAVVISARGTQVDVDDLQDSLTVRASHRDVDISSVASGVSINSRYAKLNLTDIKGNIVIDSSSDVISAENIKGGLTLKARSTGIRASGIQGPLDIRTSLKNVVVNDFSDICRIRNEWANVSVSSNAVAKDLSIINSNGDVDLYLPEQASFRIDATARSGKVESDYPGLVPTREANTASLKTRVREGGPVITLETDHSDIRVFRSRGERRSFNTARSRSKRPYWTMGPVQILPQNFMIRRAETGRSRP